MDTSLNPLTDTLLGTVPAHPRTLCERQAATLAALDSFMEQDEAEHRETLRVLRQALEEDRAGQRPAFGGAEERMARADALW